MPVRSQTLTASLACALAFVLVTSGCDASGAAARASYEDALAALEEGDLDRAEAAAADAAERGGAAFDALRDFVDGNVAFARCEQAAAQAADAGAEPFAWDIAVKRCEKARDAWARAAATRADWPAARRNVERALLRLEKLRESRRKAGGGDRRKEKGGKGKPVVIPPAPGKPDAPKPGKDAGGQGSPEGAPEADPGTAQLTELPPEAVLGLLEALGEKQKEKRAVRTRRRAEQPGVEKDW